MAELLVIEKLGENIVSGIIAKILVKPGDTIKKGDVLLEMETDKAVLDVQSDRGGVIKKVLIKEGATVKPGDSYMELESSSADSVNKSLSQEKTKKASAPAKETSLKHDSPNYQAEPKSNNDNDNDNKAEGEVIISKTPNLGEDISQAKLVKVLVKKGDVLKQGDPVAELETDKANFEVPAPDAGTVVEVYLKEGVDIKTGDNLFKIKLSASSDIIKDVKEEEKIKSDEPTQSQASSVKSEQGGAITDETDGVDATIAPQNNHHEVKSSSAKADIFAGISLNSSPKVRRFAREIGVILDQVTGTGARGRISLKDVKNHARLLNEGGSISTERGTSVSAELPDFTKFGELEVKELGAIKKATAIHMSKVWQIVPMVTQMDKADVTDLEKFRKDNREFFIQKGAKLTMTAILIKVLAILLNDFPYFNASFDETNYQAILKKYINIGVAVDTPNGLLVPVIKDVDHKSILDISLKLGEISKKARDRKMGLADLSGGSFTISNLGGISGEGFTPLVNWPEVAILGVGRSEIKPIYNGKTFEPRLVMPLSLSYDHRLIDGAEAARFLKQMVIMLEEPFKMALLN